MKSRVAGTLSHPASAKLQRDPCGQSSSQYCTRVFLHATHTCTRRPGSGAGGGGGTAGGGGAAGGTWVNQAAGTTTGGDPEVATLKTIPASPPACQAQECLYHQKLS